MYKYYLNKVRSLPFHVLIRKVLNKGKQLIAQKQSRSRDHKRTTYDKKFPQGDLYFYFPRLEIEYLLPHAETIANVTQHFLEHRFDILGSGWVQVKHGMCCRGLEGYRYNMGGIVHADPKARWLEERINDSNLNESKRIWRLIFENSETPKPIIPSSNLKSNTYIPIDWHLDFRSGYRWRESMWYLDIPFGHKPGVDIKVPLELSRMQHFAQFAFAYALANWEAKGNRLDLTGEKKGHSDDRMFKEPEIYPIEFRNQVLDFMATNPPRFGVNWSCPMDAGIRVANWLVAYDMFRAYGMQFEEEFEEKFLRSVYEHGRHIIENLEWYQELHGNHYLSDIVGLLFVAAYLPRTQETDVWLAFAIQELVNEVEYQFTPDGANYEASTSYHRLSAELVIYGTALILGLSPEKRAALKDYDCRLHHVTPKLKPAPIQLYPLQGDGAHIPFPTSYIDRLIKMAEFTMHITRPDGHIPQIGDNDSGRFLKLQPDYLKMTVAKAKVTYKNLSDYSELQNESNYLLEDCLDHHHLVAALNGLFARDDFTAFSRRGALDTCLIQHMFGNMYIPSCQRQKEVFPFIEGICQNGVRLCSYPDFGLYIYRSRRIYLALHCGPVGQNGNGGHVHNDQLSFELVVDKTPLIVDPGTYLYTPLPQMRNLFRSTAMHNTLAVTNREQNTWEEGMTGLFQINDHSRAKVLYLNEHKFIGEHCGFGPIHRRSIEIDEEHINGVDECGAVGKKSISFHLAPGVKVDLKNDNNSVGLYLDGLRIRLNGEPGEWAVQETFYSPAYSVVQKSMVILLQGFAESFRWTIKIL